ncbi:unnamed protein product [Rotaria sordida]|uniref:Uncharacterized protein n=1 Tax=Rotaria sordida TaxID=392033 RepID=A0A815CTZ6_9BILA|nr:unnamed protein product [Rotaria sordida]CAF1026026.1 unnamed protein product [Rotaria sordida]CAF1077519.1 unnamed protein product [Rotaria sordida]CAF1109148.1 unnamed protein product [Rotaria sordida]CAF1288096.1 unnamed protein product [Rotaria sordida]
MNAIPYKRYRRQYMQVPRDDLPYGGWTGGSDNPSGAIPGAYYGTGINPNYGDLGPNINDADSSISAISYSQGYSPNSGLIPNWNQQLQQQQYNLYSNNYNALQRPNINNYFHRPYNRYPPGSPGWYASGSNYWYNNGQSIISHTWLLITSILISIISM